MKIQYIEKRMSEDRLVVVAQANRIIEAYLAQGFKLTLRQLYYQFVAKGLLPNEQRQYDRLGDIISDARLLGLVSWEAIEDRTRNLKKLTTWGSPQDILEACERSYREDLWKDQKYRPEVWIEKEALSGVIERVCNELRVPFIACRGYMSQSEQWAAGRRFKRWQDDFGQVPVVLHLGDHDPSGMDMTRDNSDRLSMFAELGVEVDRLALNMDQVLEQSPPPNPAKMTDTRADGYVSQYGYDSWELDALEPVYIEDLIREAVLARRDEDKWAESLKEEDRVKRQLSFVANNFDNLMAESGMDTEEDPDDECDEEEEDH
jgi:hypothetical protein